MPNKIGRFDVLSEITKSAMGSVYKATDPETGQTVALKTLRLEMLSSEHSAALVQQILQEAESTKILNSPNIALLYGAGEMEGQLCAAMEYVQGNSIATMLARKEGFSIWDLLDISRQACQGLDHAHSHNVAHYSLEPAKVMVTWDGTVKILAFGISMMGAMASQATGQPPALLHYMSPEQLHGDPLDARSNLFSWGAILYEMVTERKAFDDEDADAVRQKILEEMPPPPVQIHPKVHPALSAVIMKALSKAPEERYQSGQDLVNDLEQCKESATKAAAKKSTPAPAPAASKPAAPAPKAPAPPITRAVASAPKVAPKPAPADKSPEIRPAARKESPRIEAAAQHSEESPQPAPSYSARKAAAAAAGLEGGGLSASTTPMLDPSAQFISSCVKASVEALANEGPSMSAAGAVEEVEESPSISVDPMMAEDPRGKAPGVSFSEIDELPPLKEAYVAPPPTSGPEAPQNPEMGTPVLVTPSEPPKPKVQPREVAKKAVKEIQKTPPKLFAYSLAGAVTIILVVIVAIAYHIRSQNEEDEDVSPAATAASAAAPAPTTAQAPAQPAPETVAPEPVATQPAVTVKPRYSSKPRKTVPASAPVVIPGQLTVNSTPEGALVHVDGQSDSGWITPYNLTGLTPGQHTVVVSKSGYASETRAIDVTSGSKLFLVVQLAQVVATLSVTSDPPGAAIFVDGHDVGHVTPAQVHAEKGSHTILVRKQGYLDEIATANVQVGQTFHFAPVLRALGNTDDIKTVGKFKKFFGGGDVAGMGTVNIKTQPKGAQVAVNRRIVEKASPVQFYLNPGNYELDISYSGYKTIHRVITVEKGGKLSFDETMEHE